MLFKAFNVDSFVATVTYTSLEEDTRLICYPQATSDYLSCLFREKNFFVEEAAIFRNG